MLFRSKNCIAWDTWVYYYNGKYYAYYLITDYSPGEGFGVAVSNDGIHFEDHGKCISASDKMVFYLGTGAVWKSPDFEKSGMFLCNYSEWRKDESGANVQNILFAYSFDLIHWEKLGDEKMFCVDERYYKKYEMEGGRWDCIFPYIEGEKYHGFFTATPKNHLGCGYATSDDGIDWIAQKPAEFDILDKGIVDGIECGAVCKRGDTFYMLMGTYVNEYGIAVLTSKTPNGKYSPQEKNFALLSNRSFRHAYFMRFFEKDNKLLVNHHCISRTSNEYDRPTTYLSPFKEAHFDDDGTLRLRWYDANDALKGPQSGDISKAFFAEGKADNGLKLTLKNGSEVYFDIDRKIGDVNVYEDSVLKEEIHKDVAFERGKLTILVREEFLELYVDGWFVTCYTLTDLVKSVCGEEIKIFEMNL